MGNATLRELNVKKVNRRNALGAAALAEPVRHG